MPGGDDLYFDGIRLENVCYGNSDGLTGVVDFGSVFRLDGLEETVIISGGDTDVTEVITESCSGGDIETVDAFSSVLFVKEAVGFNCCSVYGILVLAHRPITESGADIEEESSEMLLELHGETDESSGLIVTFFNTQDVRFHEVEGL